MDLGALTLQGYSLGGVETAVAAPELRLAFDVGRGRGDLLRCDNIALTHTHMDHVGGLPFLIALRQLYRMAPPTVYVPGQLAAELAAMLKAFEPLQRFPMACTIVPVEAGQRYPLRRDLYLEPFRTYHPVPSFGYTVVQTVEKLDPSLLGLPGHEIAARRKRGEQVTRTEERAILSVTGDTLAQVLEKQPHILRSEVLVLECTFLDERKPLAEAHAGGHVHLSDLWPFVDAFENRTLVLSHFSQIYSGAQIGALLTPFAERVKPVVRALPTEPGGPEPTVGARPASDQ
ncbi:MAG: ribonuclease Z [Deltaproteobacteria bacterium HGW-Deltaproteobacteria-14]|jgi:ribonuclease Z|nr:MAG: ribonuclease Z [Deltaproteobacteria bacterium HGW-Deltaproteobacteria-14]